MAGMAAEVRCAAAAEAHPLDLPVDVGGHDSRKVGVDALLVHAGLLWRSTELQGCGGGSVVNLHLW